MFEHNRNLSGSVILLKKMTSEVWSVGDISKIRQIKILLSEAWALSMRVLICDSYHWKKWIQSFVVLPFHRRELVGDFGEKSGIRSLRIFSKSLAQWVWYAFTNYRLSWASHVIPLSMMSCWGFYIGLRSLCFLLALFTEGFRSCHMKWTFMYSTGDP